MLTTACPGEPYEMIAQTLRAMVAVRYPHTNYLCDEGDDPLLRQLCAELGVVHVTRTDKRDAKAGNINNALQQATGEICVVLDPDHVPAPDFLETVLPYFADEKVGFVQVVQAYGNRFKSLVAKGAAEQTYQFYGPMMMAMGRYGTAQAIGANCTFRRAALDSIGGHAAGLSEDMHTAMRLHAAGWQSVYVTKIVARGLVPDTLASYYKQQLKWSRGTFDLLCWVLPGIWSKLTLRQKVHYLTVPLYFLSGLIVFIDIFVPVVSLLTSRTPWQIQFDEFLLHTSPLLVMGLLIRQYSQRWLQEPHERGFHIMGGMLTMSTWWIYLTGLVYTLLNIKVPYIPTPKDDRPANHWRLIAPNLFVCLFSVWAIAYGLQRDASPYNQFMATFAGWNALVLGFCALIGLEAWLQMVIRHLMSFRFSAEGLIILLRWQYRLKQGLYYVFREHAVASLFFVSLAAVTYQGILLQLPLSPTSPTIVRTATGAFLVGGNAAFAPESTTQTLWHLPWDCSSEMCDFPDAALTQSPEQDGYPYVVWTLTASANASNGRLNQLLEGNYNAYLAQLARAAQSCPGPVFVQLVAPVDDFTDSVLYRRAWRYVVSSLQRQGVDNLVWVWEMPTIANRMAYYPGHQYINWISVRTDHVSGPADLQRHYEPLRADLMQLQVVSPVIFTAVNSQATYPFQTTTALLNRWPEVRAFYLQTATDTAQTRRPAPETIASRTEKLQAPLPLSISSARSRWGYTSVNPVRGIAYNPGQTDWRDGEEVLSRQQLEKDFQRLRKMGANTIRRYAPNENDHNLLTVAYELGLDVIYGFWLDPEIDYSDSIKAGRLVQRVIEQATAVRAYPAIAAWAPGSSTWHLLKYHFSEPHLSKVRAAYLSTVETIAQQLHALDAHRPVTTAFDILSQTQGNLRDWEMACPSLDFISLNVRHPAQLVYLQTWLRKSTATRPYLISEFGPRTHFDAPFVRTEKDGLLIEDKDFQKAALYAGKWQRLIASDPQLMGGIAYCWRDRLGVSPTWHGLTDMRGGLKPAYYALCQAWLDSVVIPPLRDVHIAGTDSLALPHQTLSFEVYSDNLLISGCEYEWQLWDEDSREVKDWLQPERNGQAVVLRAAKVGTYRLYVFIRKGESVVTATRTIYIWEKDLSKSSTPERMALLSS